MAPVPGFSTVESKNAITGSISKPISAVNTISTAVSLSRK